MSKGPEDLPQLTPLCFRLVSVIHPVFVQCGQLDNNIVNMLLSHLLCGQASWVLFIISSQELMSELVLFIIFSFSLKAKKVFISLKKKNTHNTKTQAVSLLFSSESCHCFVWMNSSLKCVCMWEWVCVGSRCARTVQCSTTRAHTSELSFPFVSAMQVQKKSKALDFFCSQEKWFYFF